MRPLQCTYRRPASIVLALLHLCMGGRGVSRGAREGGEGAWEAGRGRREHRRRKGKWEVGGDRGGMEGRTEEGRLEGQREGERKEGRMEGERESKLDTRNTLG